MKDVTEEEIQTKIENHLAKLSTRQNNITKSVLKSSLVVDDAFKPSKKILSNIKSSFNIIHHDETRTVE
jgi:hypothetical protein